MYYQLTPLEEYAFFYSDNEKQFNMSSRLREPENQVLPRRA